MTDALRTVTIVIPSGYKDAAEFLKDCEFQEAESVVERCAQIVEASEAKAYWSVQERLVDIAASIRALKSPSVAVQPVRECYKLDNANRVFFYEQDFYVLSNFSAFTLQWPVSRSDNRLKFDTSEAAYHWMKFMPNELGIAAQVRAAPSAHEAFKIAEHYRSVRRKDWDEVKIGIMRDILRAKADQHEYVRRKLLATGDRELIEDSWRDDYWGWGPNRDGKNMLGKLWMEVRAELRASAASSTNQPSEEGK